ncbi:MAG: NERD domain-containing protein [Desulfotignum sp.]|nr:NERD domain-containing protein [Desulfotignum sp.]
MNPLLIAQVASPLFVLGILYLIIIGYRQYNLRKKTRTPFTENALLRLPGHSLDLQIRDINEKIISYIFILFVFSIMLANSIVSIFSHQKQGITSPFFLLWLIVILGLFFFVFKIVQSLSQREKLRLGYFGELVTAEALSRLMPEGNYVFHDFPADNFNIDHIVVGPAGVFAIETKTRSKVLSGDNKQAATATYNGREIEFSNFKDTKYLEQAKRQAKWLTGWLKNSTGESVKVFPVVCLPGFFVQNTTAPDGMFVTNPKQLKNVIRSKNNTILDDKKIHQIVHQLDQKCRDVEIVSKQYDAKK